MFHLKSFSAVTTSSGVWSLIHIFTLVGVTWTYPVLSGCSPLALFSLSMYSNGMPKMNTTLRAGTWAHTQMKLCSPWTHKGHTLVMDVHKYLHCWQSPRPLAPTGSLPLMEMELLQWSHAANMCQEQGWISRASYLTDYLGVSLLVCLNDKGTRAHVCCRGLPEHSCMCLLVGICSRVSGWAMFLYFIYI